LRLAVGVTACGAQDSQVKEVESMSIRYPNPQQDKAPQHDPEAGQRRLQALQQSALFAKIDPTTAMRVAEHLVEETWPAGYVVFEDKAPGDTLYIVTSGRVQISKLLENGRKHVLVEMGPGEFFGEMALLEDKPRSAQVSTMIATTLLAMSREMFSALIERYPAVAVNFLREISARLRLRNQLQESLLGEKQALVEELATKNRALEQALTELRAALETVAEHERVKRDLEIARQIQQQMLPTAFPQCPGLALHAITTPSRWVGGDFYDAVQLAPQQVSLLLGDVSGKGIPAALQMARLMGEFRACVSHQADPEGVMRVLNGLLCQRNTTMGSFVTVQYLVLDLAQRRMRFICAGHPPILLRRTDGQLESLGAMHNIPLGIEETFVYRQEEYAFAPGDTLLLYSDGAYELRNMAGDLWGLPRLSACFAAIAAPPVGVIQALQVAQQAFGGVQHEHPHDDTTLLCAQMC
jgi:sigma-B regulation protein RsbU (phosphoserine phosphatase)